MQFINPNHIHTLAQLKELYSDAILVELNKSYRSTYEIITFAKGIGQVDTLEPMERHGEIPMVIPCTDRQNELAKIKTKLNVFLQGSRASLGIILKTNNDAKELYNLLAQEYEIQLISSDSTSFSNGISVTSVQMSKGLEFDEVLVSNVSDETYHTEYDRSLLYIACTRAMHKLSLFYTGRLTTLIPEQKENQKHE